MCPSWRAAVYVFENFDYEVLHHDISDTGSGTDCAIGGGGEGDTRGTFDARIHTPLCGKKRPLSPLCISPRCEFTPRAAT